MSHKFLSKSSFHVFLLRCDQDLAKEIAQAGCSYCGGVLHHANYPRSPFGLPQSLRCYYQTRMSFCCNRCRKRTTTPSMRFMGRCRYVASILLLISALTCKGSWRNCARIRKCFGVTLSVNTWKRWCRWWRECFITTSFWQQAKSRVVSARQQSPYPYTLFILFQGNLQQRLILLLHFVLPMTAGILRAV